MSNVLTRKFSNEQSGITGLETAIILIAFVVVASVFAYVVLSAGMFSSQKSQESIYEGIKTAQGTIEIRGAVIAMSETTGANGCISQLTFTVATTMGGQAIDFTPPDPDGGTGRPADGSNNKVVITYYDEYQKIDDLYWTLTKLGHCSNDNLLDSGEHFQITIGNAVAGENGGNLVDALTHDLGPDTKFTLEVKGPVGATLMFERTTPGFIDATLNLH